MEAARHLAKFAALVEQHHQIMAIFKYLKQDVEDSVRAVVVWCCSALWKLLETQDAVANILPFIVNSQQDESPQVRQMVAQQIIELYKAVGSDVPRTKLVSTYVRLLHDDEVQVRTAAASQVTTFCQILSPEYLVQHVLPSVEELSSLFPSEILYIKMKIALFKLERGDQKDCKNLLEEGQTTLDSMTDIDPSLYGSYYWVSSQYHKARQEFAKFYRCALLYLAYTSVESLSQSFKFSQKSMKKYFAKVPKSSLASQNIPVQIQEENANIPEASLHSSQEFDLASLKADPAERTEILKYHPNHRDIIRRAYLQKGPCQPRKHKFPITNFSGYLRRFSPDWFDEFDWLEYSISTDRAYCFNCYLFRDDSLHQGGGEVFSTKGFKSWQKKKSLDIHVGGPNSIHNRNKKKCADLMLQQQSIQSAFERQSNQVKHDYRVRLTASIDVVRLLLNQGLAFRGHDESKSSLNRGNFLELLSWYATKCDNIRDFVLENAPQNDQMTSPMIQKDIVAACKFETIKGIMEELNGDYFSLLVDESFDVSRKEQMAIVIRYVDRMGFVMERLIDIVHVKDTSVSSLKGAIVDSLAQHSLSLSYVRGQCYDGASNMQGDIKGLKRLIMQESRSAHSIHCFAHQLQLSLVGVCKKCVQVSSLVQLVSNILNVLGASFKRMDGYRESQRRKIQEALDIGELTTGRGLNQERGLSRACDTRWGSHHSSFCNFILNFGTIIEILDELVVDARSTDDRAKASGYLEKCQSFEVVFTVHLMKDVLGKTAELNTFLPKKEQDIANAMLLVQVAKRGLQILRDNGWDELLNKDLAIDLSLSAMLGDEIYNFGELLTHPIMESLIGTKDEWLYHILEAFKSGDLIGYQELCAAHQAAFTAQPALLQNKTKLLEKINIMCLMEIIFSRTAEDRTIPLSVIAERTKLSVEDVEYLLMKSLCVHLIEGTIDQVEGTVHVSWVRPRVLEIPQIKSLRDRLDNWVEKVQTTLQFVEEPDLVASTNIKNVLI